jgi:hypothetical protein
MQAVAVKQFIRRIENFSAPTFGVSERIYSHESPAIRYRQLIRPDTYKSTYTLPVVNGVLVFACVGFCGHQKQQNRDSTRLYRGVARGKVVLCGGGLAERVSGEHHLFATVSAC